MSKALGTMKQGDTIECEVAHGERESFGRSVIPTAKRNVTRLGLWLGWTGCEATLISTDRRTPDGQCVSIVRFMRTR